MVQNRLRQRYGTVCASKRVSPDMDASWTKVIAALIAGLGIGSAVTAWIQYLLKRKEAAYESQRKDLEARYRVVILLMYAAFDFEANKTAIRINRPDLVDRPAILGDLTAEWYNMTLFASARTLESLRTFIKNPTKKTCRRRPQR